MKRTLLGLLWLTLGCMSLVGCSSKLTQDNEYSGFLSNYSDLKPTTSASGAEVLRWVDPNFNKANYSKLIFQPVRYYPEPRPTSQVSQKTLNGILLYTNQQLHNAAASKLQIVDKPGPGTLLFRGAITAVNTSNKDLEFYEVIPVAMVIAGTQMATGHRTMNSHIYFEGEIVDSLTNKPLVKLVRKGSGKTVNNSDQPLTVNDLKSAIDNLTSDADAWYRQY